MEAFALEFEMRPQDKHYSRQPMDIRRGDIPTNQGRVHK